MKVGSLFTGYGGLDLAVGGDLAWYAEIEPAACKVLAAHYPGVPNLGDITTINWAEVESVDILTGGYPCQPFSHAGQRKGKNDERHLWPYVLNAIRGIRPRYAIMENVSGHLSLGFDSVLTDLTEIGWAAEWGTFRASDVGAPHRRERLFIIACNPDNDGRPAGERGRSLREGTVARGSHETSSNGELKGASDSLIAHADSARRGEHSRAVTIQKELVAIEHDCDNAADTEHNGLNGGTLARGIGESENQGRLQQSQRRDSDPVADTSGDGHGQQLHAGAMAGVEGQTESHAQQRERSRRESDPGSIDNAADTDMPSSKTLTRRQGSRDAGRLQLVERGGSVTADTDNGHGQAIGGVQGLRGRHASRGDVPEMSTVDWGKYAPAIGRWESFLGRPAPEPTVERKDKRRLNPQFVEWMMGLPDGHVTGHGLSAAQELKMLGNGVVPQQAHAAITQLMQRVQSWAN